MKEIVVSTFEELKKQIDDLIVKYGRHSFSGHSAPNSVLFRGQANHQWELESTLERAGKRNWTLKRYYELAETIRPTIESFYPLPFSEVSRSEVDTWLQTVKEHGFIKILAYDYLLYLRHHGFPSPFVDWTTSLYIAAGFAFFPENTNAECRAIYMFIEKPEGGKGGIVGAPEIAGLGKYVKTDKRHLLQQADYTICFNRANENIPLETYDKVISNQEYSYQDLLWKFIVPSAEREPVLKFLESVNITHFSLMPSEENLLSSLWLRHVTLPDYDWARFNKKPEA